LMDGIAAQARDQNAGDLERPLLGREACQDTQRQASTEPEQGRPLPLEGSQKAQFAQQEIEDPCEHGGRLEGNRVGPVRSSRAPRGLHPERLTTRRCFLEARARQGEKNWAFSSELGERALPGACRPAPCQEASGDDGSVRLGDRASGDRPPTRPPSRWPPAVRSADWENRLSPAQLTRLLAEGSLSSWVTGVPRLRRVILA